MKLISISTLIKYKTIVNFQFKRIFKKSSKNNFRIPLMTRFSVPWKRKLLFLGEIRSLGSIPYAHVLSPDAP